MDQKRLDQVIENNFSVEINGFIEKFQSSEHCLTELWRWRGWRYDSRKKILIFDCNSTGCDGTQAKRTQLKNHPGNKYVVYKCEKCGSTISEISETVFRNIRKRQWIWFFSLYLMMLLDGRKPYNYVANAYFDNKIDHSNKKTFPKTKKNLHVVKKQSREAMDTLYKRVFTGNNKENTLLEYSRFFGASYCYNSFEDWYNAEDHIKLQWKLAWCGTKSFIHNELRDWIRIEYGVPASKIKFARAFKDAIKAKQGDWLLGFQVKKSGIIALKWIKVERVLHNTDLIDAIELNYSSYKLVEQFNNGVDSKEAFKKCSILDDKQNKVIHALGKDGFKSQIFHVYKKGWKSKPPFTFDRDFENIFKDKISNWIPENEDKSNTVFDISENLLKDILMAVKKVRNY